MAGNMHERCWDCDGSYLSGSQADPRGPASGPYRVNRGGSWSTWAGGCRAARRYRLHIGPDNTDYLTGFRPARNSVP